MVELAVAPTPRTLPPEPPAHRRPSREATVAALAFAAASVAVLVRSPRLLEPDDAAYRASIVALSHGEVTLSGAQYRALARQLQGGIAQWIQLADGRWMSEKNPGYPFLAVAFQWLGAERLTPLFFGAVACVALYLGARRWLGASGGAVAVVLYASSGAALAFMWRSYMPTFTDASLVATGAGLLLWTMLANDASPRRRALVGLVAFVALELATFARYTDVTALLVACVVAVLLARRCGLTARAVWAWLASVAAFCGLDLAWNAHFYGGPLHTGYGPGEVSFSLGALPQNLTHLSVPLLASMPVAILAAAALAGIGRGLLFDRSRPARRRDAVVAGSLLGVWLGTWGLYELYDWTAQMGTGGGDVHVIRFYLPALGALCLLGAWAVRRIPAPWSLATLAAICIAGLLSFQSLVSVPAFGRGPAGPGPLRSPVGGQLPPGPPAGGVPPGS